MRTTLAAAAAATAATAATLAVVTLAPGDDARAAEANAVTPSSLQRQVDGLKKRVRVSILRANGANKRSRANAGVLAGVASATGPQGPTGAQGPVGPTGPVGATGPAGPPGLVDPSKVNRREFSTVATVDSAASALLQADCQPGETAVGGGFSAPIGFVGEASIPLAAGWSARFRNISGAQQTVGFFVHVVCVAP